MRDGLCERHPRHGEPNHVSVAVLPTARWRLAPTGGRSWVLGLVVAVLALGIAVLALTRLPVASPLLGAASSASTAGGPLVLVSGRDDHGLLAQHEVSVLAEPAGRAVVGRLHDGLPVRVVEERGEWLRVQTLDRPAVTGWVNDFHLRDRAVWLERQVQVRLVDARVDGETLLVGIRPLAEPSAALSWVPVEQLREVGARADQPDHSH